VSTRRRFLRETLTLVAGAALSARARAQDAVTGFDYIIVGAGSSGCVIANRLTADPSIRVLLVEAGGPASHPAASVPGRWTSLIGSELDWQYTTEPDPAIDNRRIAWPRGKGYGGSSAINALSYARGHRLSFDGWAAAAGPAWSYQSLLPLFRRSEANSRGSSEYHGADGPWTVAATRDPHAGHTAFLDAARQLGFDAAPDWDFDGARQENAAGFYQKTIRDGRRFSVAEAFLLPALARPNLVVSPHSLALSVQFDGRRAAGVALIRDGRRLVMRARREVIVAAGALESPVLLMRSGIGPGAALRALGIGVVADRAEVGANLQDHPRIGVRWQGRTSLPGSSVTAGLFTHSRGRSTGSEPNLQFYVGRGLDDPDPFITLTVALTRPGSRGAIELSSSDPAASHGIRIRARYFHDARDLDAMVEGVRLARALAETRAFGPLRGSAIAPATGVTTPDQIRAFIRASSETMFHPAGTCRMGLDQASVVDPALRVRGVEGLRVADASIMPAVVNAQINAACVLIGERAADLLRA
jgi:choline dehydrogenase